MLFRSIASHAEPIAPMSAATSFATDRGTRIAFVVELATQLHAYGTTAQRLEGAVVAVAQALGMRCDAWSNPTGLILSFAPTDAAPHTDDTTRVIRLAPGETDLQRLAQADRIAESVLAGNLDVQAGFLALRALQQPPASRQRVMQVLGFGLASAAVAGLLRLPWLDIGVAGVTGLLIGVLQDAAAGRPQLREAGDALAGMLAGMLAVAVAAWVAPINLNTVIIASLIVLLPGLSLTNAVNELASQHLASGTARFAGALTTMLKLTVGTAIAVKIAEFSGLQLQVRAWRPQPWWVEAAALLLGAYAFAVLFRAERRDYPLVMLAAVGGYLVSRGADLRWGSPTGIFLSALASTAAGNAYARWANRPGALVRVPGLIMLVPGSAALRGFMTLVQQGDVAAGERSLLLVLQILLALIAGLLFGNLLLPARRHL